jgi:hypothetical protein
MVQSIVIKSVVFVQHHPMTTSLLWDMKSVKVLFRVYQQKWNLEINQKMKFPSKIFKKYYKAFYRTQFCTFDFETRSDEDGQHIPFSHHNFFDFSKRVRYLESSWDLKLKIWYSTRSVVLKFFSFDKTSQEQLSAEKTLHPISLRSIGRGS